MNIWAEEMMTIIGCFLASVSELHYEVLPESETSFSVTFQQPNTNSLAVCEYLVSLIITKITKNKVSQSKQSQIASTCEKLQPFQNQQQWPIFIEFGLEDFFRLYAV